MRRGKTWWWCLAAVALLALPPSASAASRTKRRTTRTDAPTAPAPTAPESSDAEASAPAAKPTAPTSAEPATPQLASANSGSSTLAARSSLQQPDAGPQKYLVSVGVGPAIPLAGGNAFFELVARGVFSIPAKTTGKASLWFVLPVRLNTYSYSMAAFGVTASASTFTLALVPTIQATGALAPRLRGYAGVGAGLAHSRTTVDNTFTGPQTTGITVGEFDLISGVEYALDDRFYVILEPVGFRVFTYGSGVVWSALLGFGASI